MAINVGLDTESPELAPRVRKGRARKTPVAQAVSQLPLVFTGERGSSVLETARLEQAQREAADYQRENTGIIEQARAAFPYQGIGGWLTRKVNEFDGPADPTFVLSEEARKGYTEDEQEQLAEARSADHLSRIQFDIAEERAANEVLGRRGGWYAAGASMLAGAPEGILTGTAIAKGLAIAGYGSIAAARAGQTGRAIGLSLAENVGGNLALTAVEDALGNRISVLDYGVAAATGLLGAGLGLPGIKAEGLIGAQRAAAEAAVRKQMEFAEKAARTLGDDASADSIAREVARLEAQELRTEAASATASVPTDRKLLPDLEKLELEELEAEKMVAGPSQDKATSDATGFITDASTNAVGEGKPVVNVRQDWIAKPGEFSTAASLERHWENLDAPVKFDDGVMTPRQKVQQEYGLDVEAARNAPVGVHGDMGDKYRGVAEWVHKNFLSDMKVHILEGNDRLPLGTGGDAWYVGKNTALIRVRPGATDTLLHELGHIVLTTQAERISPRHLEGFKQWHAEWQKNYTAARPATGDVSGATRTALERGTVGRHYTRDTLRPGTPGFVNSLYDIMANVVNRVTGDLQKTHPQSIKYATDYIPNFDEFGAEQFTKYIEGAVAQVTGWKPARLPEALLDFFVSMWSKFAKLFDFARDNNLLAPDVRAQDFFHAIYKKNKAEGSKQARAAAGMDVVDRDYGPRGPMSSSQAPQQQPNLAWLQDPIAVKYGIDLLPMDTPAARAEAKAILDLYKRASDPAAPWNNIPADKIASITSNSYFDVASTSLTMLKSENPVVRMMAAELIESPSGAAGRRSTAAIAKFMHERAYMGNVINEVQAAYKGWRNANGGGVVEDFMGGEKWKHFNRLVAEEIEARQAGAGFEAPPAVSQAADALERAYERMRTAQTDAKTIGWAGLPTTSRGYMPHRMSAEAVRNLSLPKRRAFQNALVDQFITIEGWDMTFASNLAAKYVDRVNARALGGYDVPANIHQVGAADMIEDALKAMGMTQTEVREQMKKYMRGGASHTKGRIKLDLRKEYDAGDGQTFTLLDLFETDQLNLVRQQAQRVSGEVALARHGIMGKPGLKLLQRAMEMGDTGLKAQPKEVEAFQQVAAEMLGDPYGNYGGKWLNRSMQMTSLARLGGMGFTQFAEFINAATGVGVAKATRGITDFARYRQEILDLAAGKKVDNPILGTIESFGGAQFGTDPYKMVFPFDNPGMQYQVNGMETVGAADRLLRGGLHAQGKLSGWRAIHSVQQRAVAEQIVAKAAEYIRAGGADTALRDMGITPDLELKLKAQLDSIAKFDANGKLTEFDITKMEDTEAAFDFVQAVHRGSQQMIQGTFIGETGKWAHDGWLRLLTQFRSFSITSVEKQWARQKSNHGVGVALLILLGSMSAAAPIYMARTYVQSIGREDQQEWLEKKLEFTAVARATLNYVAMSGLSGDLLDALSSITGLGKATGGRQGGTTEFVGSVIAPAAGLADDVWRGLQNSKDGTDPHDLVKALPFSKLPMLGPAINALD